MDDTRPFQTDGDVEQDFPDADEPQMDAPPQIGNDERRMHVRAYNYWVSLLHGRDFPSIEDLDPAGIEDFSRHSVLLDFTCGPEGATFAYLGAALRAEGEIGNDVRAISEVPPRSVLSRLTEHYLEIIANRAPIGFEAEYTNQRGCPTMYRGILMPFTSDGDTIDFIYGVINWKEVVEVEADDDIRAAVNAILSDVPAPVAATPVWADGPNGLPPVEVDVAAHGFAGFSIPDEAPLYDQLAAARECVEEMSAADQRSHAALYQALGRAYDFARAAEQDADGYAEILDDAGLVVQARAPMTPIVKLVFGIGYDKTRLAEYAAVLSHARRQDLPCGTLVELLEHHPGGLKAIVKAERELRRPPARPDRERAARTALAAAPALAKVTIAGIDTDFVNLVGRRENDGSVSILGASAIADNQLVRITRTLRR